MWHESLLTLQICCLNKIKDVKLYMIFQNKALYACEVITLAYWVHQTEILIHSFKTNIYWKFTSWVGHWKFYILKTLMPSEILSQVVDIIEICIVLSNVLRVLTGNKMSYWTMILPGIFSIWYLYYWNMKDD